MDTFLTVNLAQASTQPAGSFFERVLTNDTIHYTSLGGWVTLFAGILAGVIVGKVVSVVQRGTAARLAKRGWQMRAIIARSFAAPTNLALIGLGISAGIGALAPSAQLNAVAGTGLALLYIIAVAWLLYNLVDLIEAILVSVTAKTESKLDDQLAPVIAKAMRVFLIVLFALFVAENIFNANIGAWLAGLGIAGLAVSLAAQDSIKNIFGSITILLDHPFVLGDFVKIGDCSGTVEEIGFRSTRIRTVAGTLLTIPNVRVADDNIENFAQRTNIRRDMDLTITYDTPPEKIKEAIALLREILTDPEIGGSFDLEKFPPRVYFDKLNADSLNIRATYWFRPVDYWLWMEHCQKVNLRVIERFNNAGIDLAFPTQTLYLAGDPKRPLGLNPAQEGNRA